MSKPSAHQPSSLAVNTDRAFVACLLAQGPLSRAAIASQTGISKPTISESAQRLLSKNLIVVCQKKDTQSSKRPALLYELNKNRGVSISLALEETSTQLSVTDFQGNQRYITQVDYDKGRTVERYCTDLIELIGDTLKQLDLPLLAIGVSIADPVDPSSGAIVAMANSPFPTAQHIDFVSLLTQEFACSVTIDNDVNWATLYEQQTTSSHNFLYLFIGRGIGCGLYFDGTLIRGHNGMAGEIGYMLLPTGGNLLESVYTESFYQQALHTPNTLADKSLELITQTLSVTCSVVAPEKLVLGGLLSTHQPFVDLLSTSLAKALPDVPILLSHEPQQASLKGAAQAAHQLGQLSLGILAEANSTTRLGFFTLQEAI